MYNLRTQKAHKHKHFMGISDIPILIFAYVLFWGLNNTILTKETLTTYSCTDMMNSSSNDSFKNKNRRNSNSKKKSKMINRNK